MRPASTFRAFEEKTRAQIMSRLENKFQTRPYFQLTIAEIAEVAEYQIKHFGPQGVANTLVDRDLILPPAAPAATTVTMIKVEQAERQELTAMVNSLVEQRIRELQGQPGLQQRFREGESAPRQTQNPGNYRGDRTIGGRTQTTFPRDNCIFCGLPGHMMRECLTLEDYIKTNRVSRDHRGFLTWPNSSQRVFHDGERCIKAVLDEVNPPRAQGNVSYYEEVMLVNSIGIDSDVLEHLGTSEDDEDLCPDEREYRLFVAMREHVTNYEATGRLGSRRIMDGIELPSRAPQKTVLQRPKGSAPFKPANSGPPVRRENSVAPAEPQQRTVPLDEIAKKHHELVEKGLSPEERAANRARAPASDDKAADKIFQRILDLDLSIPVRDLLGASPELRKLYQKFTTNKHVQINEVNVLTDFNEEDDGNEVFNISTYEHTLSRTDSGEFAAHNSVALHTMNIQIGDVPIDAIVDTGATICCMSEDVWHQIGSPIYSERSIKMRDANGNSAGTLGATSNVAVNIGGIIFYLTFHVVANAPFDVILGTPFCAIASLKLIWHPSCRLMFELTDPNAERKSPVLIPAMTSKHHRRISPPQSSVMQDF